MTSTDGGMRPVVSVVVLTYNSLKVLPECLASLERCTSASDLEVIVADNGSNDGTVDWLCAYEAIAKSKPFARFVFLPLGKNRGFAYGNNRAMEQSSGEYILLLNPDTIVGERAIETCVARLRENPDIGAVGCRLTLPNGKLDLACRRSLPTLWNSFCRFSRLSFIFPRSRLFAGYNLTYLDEYGSYDVECLCGAFMMVPRRVYEAVGGLDEDFFMYGEDVDWCCRILRGGYRIRYEGSVETLHLKGGSGGRRTPRSKRAFYGAIWLYFTKWGLVRMV
ncbi:MAG: glycosyltransferase family 2 protein [Alicyclobacillus sp.]|uniref:glycosyltransferase family 2 protein n=1 Tax=Alicyclobacillus sendaiensis TaxID=192387 RepID=UPI0026F42C6E|nr:glycosyltransferase family 2 protein [Alicyclobacillus sendaiensis]MCL6444331.1 glycosyltransferase family 2 protein [Alicyclobacillus sp.]